MNRRILFFFFLWTNWDIGVYRLFLGVLHTHIWGSIARNIRICLAFLGETALYRLCFFCSKGQPLIEDWPDITLWSKRLSVTRLVA
jgi:hypothetical protein